MSLHTGMYLILSSPGLLVFSNCALEQKHLDQGSAETSIIFVPCPADHQGEGVESSFLYSSTWNGIYNEVWSLYIIRNFIYTVRSQLNAHQITAEVKYPHFSVPKIYIFIICNHNHKKITLWKNFSNPMLYLHVIKKYSDFPIWWTVSIMIIFYDHLPLVSYGNEGH